MPKIAKSNPSKGDKYERQKALTAERVKRFRAKMSEEALEEKRRKDRERYKVLKEKNLIKQVADLTPREQRKKKKNWRKYSEKYRTKNQNTQRILNNTPPESDEDGQVGELQIVSQQKLRGRKAVRRDRAKAYRTIKKQEKQIEDLQRRLRKYKKRLQRNEKKMLSQNSPTPDEKVRNLLGKENVSLAVRKRLFVGFTLEKQLEHQIKNTPSKSKERHILQKAIGSKIIHKYRIQTHLKKIVPYKLNRVLTEQFSLQYSRKKYNSKRVKEALRLRTFYEDDMVSRMCPGKKDVKSCGKIKKQRRILLDSMKHLYSRYVKEFKSKISYKTFTRARPFWVTPPKSQDRDTCACIKHSNMEFLVFGLKKVNAIKENSAREALNTVLCSVKKEDCVKGKCKLCKNKNIQFCNREDYNIKYYVWKTSKEKRLIKGEEKVLKRMVKVQEMKKISEVKKPFEIMLNDFKQHVFKMYHQAAEKKSVQDNLKVGELMFLIDFSENYNTKYEHEIQAMHFGASKGQISLHTGVRYHNKEGNIISKSFCTVSDNLAHQAHAVWAHLDPILQDSASVFPSTHTIHIFSDSPSSQYRNKKNLYLLYTLLPTYFPSLQSFTWNFSEPGHGKGAMDGVGGSLKRRADQYVLHGHDIKCAADFVEAFDQSKILLIEICQENIENMKNKLPEKIAPIKQIMKIKQVTYCSGKMYGRTLSCFKCPAEKICSHYSFSDKSIISSDNNRTATGPKIRLRVSDVYTSEEDEPPSPRNCQANVLLEEDTSVHVTKSQTFDKMGSSIEQAEYELGTYVLVRFESHKNSSQFVGVCQSVVEEGEIKVMFLKTITNDKTTFIVNEADIAYISIEQIVAILPSPKLLLKGRRSFYKFSCSVDVY